jgi:hypothetical protein
MQFKNTFASQASSGASFDLQRQDLFKFQIILPAFLRLDWTENVEFAVEKFPFPERSIELTGIKYLQQTNYQIGGDTPTPPIEVPIRYAFAQQTAMALEKWWTMIRNPRTGGVGLTSRCKTTGTFHWLVPNQAQQEADVTNNSDRDSLVLQSGLVYKLEGVLLKGLKCSDADMTTSGKVDVQASISIDRWYPVDLNNMIAPV